MRTFSRESSPVAVHRDDVPGAAAAAPRRRPAARPPMATPRALYLALKEMRRPHKLDLTATYAEGPGFIRLALGPLVAEFPATDAGRLVERLAERRRSQAWLPQETMIAVACSLPGASAVGRTRELLKSLNLWIETEPPRAEDIMTEQDSNIQHRS
ncbi:hypothetical protein DB346_24285 [Verrucomicrobia bacterium LW23]|nr:hypothetical protein DB346_24285 [Verrucomicrobia bacterium LW23]